MNKATETMNLVVLFQRRGASSPLVLSMPCGDYNFFLYSFLAGYIVQFSGPWIDNPPAPPRV